MALLGDGGGFASIFGYEDDRAREDREQRQLQRKMQEDAARFRRESEAPVKRLQANLFRHETGNRIRGLELNFQRQAAEDTARTEALDFRKFASDLTRPMVEKLTPDLTGQGLPFGSPTYQRAAQQAHERGRYQRPPPPDLSDTGQAFGAGLVPGMLEQSGIRASPEEVSRLKAYGPDVAASLIEQGNIGPI